MLAATVATAVGHGIGAERVAGYSGVAIRVAGVLMVLAGIGQLYVATTY